VSHDAPNGVFAVTLQPWEDASIIATYNDADTAFSWGLYSMTESS